MDTPTSDLPPTLTTSTLPFGPCDADQTPFFIVREGLPADDVLAHVSLLLKCAMETGYGLCEGPTPERGLLWSTLHSVDAAKALVDSLLVRAG